MIKLLLLSIVAVGLSSCASGPGAGVKPPTTNPKFVVKLKGTPDWSSPEQIKKDLGNKVSVHKNVVDLNGGEINGKNLKHSGNSQDESNVGVKIRMDNLTIKNGFAKDLGGGLISYAKNTTFQNITFTGTSEDFVSNQKDVSDNFRVIDCKFYNNSKGDKSIQINGAVNALVRDTYVSGAITGVRLGESSSKRRGEARVENCTFENVSTALNIDGKMKVYTKGITLKNVPKPYVVNDGSKLIEN